MAQVGIVRRGNSFFREYAIEPGDALIPICLRYGCRDWRAVYDHPENAAFRARFPDPDQIDFVNPVNLLIPLPSAAASGRRRRGRPIEDFMVARVQDMAGNPLANTDLRLIAPGPPFPNVLTRKTSAQGDIIVDNPFGGTWQLVSEGHYLAPSGTTVVPLPPPADVETLRSSPGADPDTGTPVKLTRNGIDVYDARPFHYIRCPMCGRIIRVVVRAAGDPINACPNDLFDLTPIETAIIVSPGSFVSPNAAQAIAAAGVTSRGEETLITSLGPVKVRWDESRFFDASGDDYTIWAVPAAGAGPAVTVRVIGRSTWGASVPLIGQPPGEYDFHGAAKGASPAYASTAVPSSLNNPLKDVFIWITIHHTADPAQGSSATAVDLQAKQQGDANADVAYAFVVDRDGAIYEGRPLGIKGEHSELFNSGNIGIVMAGDFESRIENGWSPDVPNLAALHSLRKLVKVLAGRFAVRSVWGHNERKRQAAAGSTECPGDELLPEMTQLRSGYHGPPP